MIHRIPALALILCALLLAACAATASQTPVYSATIFQKMDPQLPRDAARRNALTLAETQARDQILQQMQQLKLSDGRTLGDLAVVDPFVRAVLQDAIVGSQIKDRTVTDEGVVSVTVELDLAPIYKMVEAYPAHSI